MDGYRFNSAGDPNTATLDENVKSAEECQKRCQQHTECVQWNYIKKDLQCWKKKTYTDNSPNENVICGPKYCPSKIIQKYE